jgi:hypothetical protein
MSLSREEVDRLVDEHFGYEAADDVEGVLASLTDDVHHHVIPSAFGAQRGKAGARAFYQAMFSAIAGEGVTPVRRLYGENFCVDEAIWHGRVNDGRAFGLAGGSGRVDFRILHIFEFRGSLISSETVWCDVDAIAGQLGQAPAAASGAPPPAAAIG